MELLTWDVYEITPGDAPVVGCMFRGRIRKLCLEKNINVLAENSTDNPECVRFAVLVGQDVEFIKEYVVSVSPGAKIRPILMDVHNPVLSKTQVNFEKRYTL